MTAKRVLSIGQCRADHGALSRTLRQHFQVEVIPADTSDEAQAKLREEAFDLVLVNRILDGDGSSGVEVIRQIKAGHSALPVMLVSNHEDAQRQAVAAGALPGFGKAGLGQPHTQGRLKPLLG